MLKQALCLYSFGAVILRTECFILDSVFDLTEHWMFVTNRFPLIRKRAAVILRFTEFSLPSPSYRLAPFSVWETLHGLEYHRLPNSTDQSIQSQFHSYTEQSFPGHTHIFTNSSENSQGVGAMLGYHVFLSHPFSPSVLYLCISCRTNDHFPSSFLF